jgi:hypothetical protein
VNLILARKKLKVCIKREVMLSISFIEAAMVGDVNIFLDNHDNNLSGELEIMIAGFKFSD